MNIGTITCIIMALSLFLLGLLFMLLKEKSVMLISGFNTLPEYERNKYDQVRLSQDMRNDFFVWTGIFIIGGILAHIIHSHMVFLTFLIWLILLLKDVHLDAEKAFAKYKRF